MVVRAFFVSVTVVALAHIGACSSSTSDDDGDDKTTVIDITDYDQTCQADTDCVVVQAGDICCGCPNAAINRADLARYQGDLGTCEAVCDIGCPNTMVAVCDQGSCVARQEMVCTPGEELFCSCGAGMMGTKTCLPDGSDFGACACP